MLYNTVTTIPFHSNSNKKRVTMQYIEFVLIFRILSYP